MIYENTVKKLCKKLKIPYFLDFLMQLFEGFFVRVFTRIFVSLLNWAPDCLMNKTWTFHLSLYKWLYLSSSAHSAEKTRGSNFVCGGGIWHWGNFRFGKGFVPAGSIYVSGSAVIHYLSAVVYTISGFAIDGTFYCLSCHCHRGAQTNRETDMKGWNISF